MPEPKERYMVLVETGGVTSAAALNASRSEAWQLTRELRAQGRHVHIMQSHAECDTCVVRGDDPLPEE